MISMRDRCSDCHSDLARVWSGRRTGPDYETIAAGARICSATGQRHRPMMPYEPIPARHRAKPPAKESGPLAILGEIFESIFDVIGSIFKGLD